MDDINALQLKLKNDALNDKNKDLKKQATALRLMTIILVLAILAAAIIFGLLANDIQKKSDERITENRRSLFSINEMITSRRLSRQERLEVFCKKGKGFVLDSYETAPPEKKMSDRQINELLVNIFTLSEQYMIDPWIAVSFARTESNFSTEAISICGAKGIFQFMPSTMKILMGTDYYDNCEKNIYYSTKMFFKMYLYLSEYFNGDIKWCAAAYVAGINRPALFYSEGRSFAEYYAWFAKSYGEDDMHLNYSFKVESFYNLYRS